MDTHLRSDNISLLLSDVFEEYDIVNQLWQTFRRTAVEPGQSSSPDFVSFADECLLCAHIVTNESAPKRDRSAHHTDSLWDPEERTLGSPSSSPVTALPLSPQTIGLIYLYAGPANIAGGEANIGVVIKPDTQHRGYAREAVQLVLRWAFEELKFHRVQAAILDTPSKDRALRLFIGSGFAHEGTKRRAVYQPEGEGMVSIWKDVTYLAMLDTEWVLKSVWTQTNCALQPPVVSVWDEMFARHAREREELLRWEEIHGRVRKTLSTETLRETTREATQDLAYLTDDASSVSASSSSSPRPNFVLTFEGEDVQMGDNLGAEPHPRWQEVVESSFAAKRQRQWLGNASLDPSLRGHMLALPSIPSTRLSDGNLQSPLTIPSLSPSSRGSTPPFSPSPSSVHSTWASDDEDDANWLLREDPFTTLHDLQSRAGPARSRMRSRTSSVSSASTGDWSDAQSSVGASSSWDILSDHEDIPREL